MRSLLEQYTADDRPTESVLETLYFQLLREGGVPTPTKQLVVPDIGRIDFAYQDLMVSIELDGGRFHSEPRVAGTRPGEVERPRSGGLESHALHLGRRHRAT